MPEFKATESQRDAILTRNSAVLVSAGAGSGKTKVLTERLIQWITDAEHPVDIDSFLIITYTKAAAGELKGRIMKEVGDALKADPGNRRLRRQNALCAKAQIGTIHSFCSRILRQNCHELGISPDFKIIDDERADDMKRAALDKVLDERYSAMDRFEGFKDLADTVGTGRNDSALENLILEFHAKIQSHARPEQWVENQKAVLRNGIGDISDTIWGKELLNAAKRKVRYLLKELDCLLEESAADAELQKVTDSVAKLADWAREFLRCLELGWDHACDCEEIAGDRWPTLKKYPDQDKMARLKDRRDRCRDALKKQQAIFNEHSEVHAKILQKTSGSMIALLELTMDFDRTYAKEKRRTSVVDYSDLEHFAARLLTDEEDHPTELARKISASYTEIMVDEYQDVSRVQDTIFRAISKNGTNLFMVGDVKQAIYGFRLADPAIFTEKYNQFQLSANAAEGEARKILLRENFRSRHEILDAANAVFRTCMSEELGNVNYDDQAALICGATYYAGSVPKPQILIRARDTKNEEENTLSGTVLEAQMVANKIRELMDSGCTIGANGTERPLKYGDIAILLRSLKNTADVFRRTFISMGIPVAFAGGGDYFNTMEVSMVMSLMTITDNPHQDIPLLTVLRSPAFGFSADELAEVKRNGQKAKDLYTSLQNAAKESEKYAGVLKRLQDFRVLAPDMTPSQLIWHVINELDLMAVCSAMEDGLHRRENLLELVELAKRFESTGYRGLHRFVLWINSLAQKGKAPALSGADSAVQIMSIHKSKGLEFPVVFVCNTDKMFNQQDTNKRVLVHPELGLGPTAYDKEKNISYATFAKTAIANRLRRELHSEELRMLYVAMTRPKERLFLTAVMKDPEKLLESCRNNLSEPMEPEVLMQAPHYMQWLMTAYLADGGQNLELSILNGAESAEMEEHEQNDPEEDEALRDELQRRLGYVYPYANVQKLPSKVTATELKGVLEPDEDALVLQKNERKTFRLPDLGRNGKPATGTERGIATHLVMQHIRFDHTSTLEEICEEIARMRAENFISEREAQCVDAQSILTLFSSELGIRMKQAKEIRREFKFSLLADAAQIFGTAEGEKLLLQGVIDCCIEENGELVVIDYKTDSVRTEEEIRERTNLYAGQIRTYANALQRITKKRVKQCILYYLRAGKEMKINL